MHGHDCATLGSIAIEGVAFDSLEPGTTVVVNTRNSQYRFMVLYDPGVVVVKGGAVFSDDTIVRLAGATAGGSTLKVGWVLVGFEMEIWDGSRSIRSSPVHSIIVDYRGHHG
ncbi:MAG: hypothetical protein ACRD3G_31290 [Vicinamibacterales bacterium]